MTYLQRKIAKKKVWEKCKKTVNCHYCGSANGMVKKCGLLKIVHDHFKRTRQGEDPVLKDYISSFEAAIEHNKDVDGLISKNQASEVS